MQDTLRVDIANSIDYLLDNHLDLFLIDLVLFTGYELLEVLLVVFEDYLEGLLFGFVDDVN